MIPFRFLGVLTATALAGTPGGIAAQVTPPNPFATSSAPADQPRPQWHHRHRLEIDGGHLHRRGARWERRGEHWERRSARLQRHGRLHDQGSWRFRGERLEHRGMRLERRGDQLERRAGRLERGRAHRPRERQERDSGRRRWRAGNGEGWL